MQYFKYNGRVEQWQNAGVKFMAALNLMYIYD